MVGIIDEELYLTPDRYKAGDEELFYSRVEALRSVYSYLLDGVSGLRNSSEIRVIFLGVGAGADIEALGLACDEKSKHLVPMVGVDASSNNFNPENQITGELLKKEVTYIGEYIRDSRNFDDLTRANLITATRLGPETIVDLYSNLPLGYDGVVMASSDRDLSSEQKRRIKHAGFKIKEFEHPITGAETFYVGKRERRKIEESGIRRGKI